jgi:hypothetical protein
MGGNITKWKYGRSAQPTLNTLHYEQHSPSEPDSRLSFQVISHPS